MGEFERIETYLKPLAGEGSQGLSDDAARAYGRVLTKDVLVEGVHFLKTDPLDLVARKALRVNMSDLIAKGAKPEAYMLGLIWPQSLPEEAFALFAKGLATEKSEQGLSLLGGDTTGGPCLSVSITMFGVPLKKEPILRQTGRPGDLLCVTGTIGDGLLGLEAAKSGEGRADAYHLPPIPFGVEVQVSRYAAASLDVSDGLIADAGHMVRAGELGIRINAASVPLSEEGRAAAHRGRLKALLTGGDDYQTLCLIDPSDAERMSGFTVIGQATATGTVEVVMPDGEVWRPARGGWDHFAEGRR